VRFFVITMLASLSLFANDVKLVSNPVTEELILTIRDPNTNRIDFRGALETLGELLALEITKDMPTITKDVKTCMNATATQLVRDKNEKIVVVTILRAGLPTFNGIMKIFKEAEAGFFGMKRDEITKEARMFYVAIPPLENKTVIIADTMVATGGSILEAIKIIEKQKPKKIIIAGVISAQYAIDRISRYNKDVIFYTTALDPKLDSRAYIVPGLGDAGDRCFGEKKDD